MSGPRKLRKRVASVSLMIEYDDDFGREKSENGREFQFEDIQGKNFVGLLTVNA
jgi:hypothetical protein